MCGIAGYINFKTDQNEQELEHQVKAMTNAMQHRGPDGDGAWACAEHGVALGHRRLAIIDLSKNGYQPMHSASERYTITYNGEIYNFLELRKELEEKDITFKGTSDTEVLLAAIELYGFDNTLPKLNGMFALALWDRKEQRLFLARDRMGKKPLYYGMVGNNFVFSSELKALRAHKNFDNRIDRNAVRLFTTKGYIPTPFSIYEGIFKLAPASYTSVNLSDKTIEQPRKYWAFEKCLKQPRNDLNEEDALKQIDALLNDATKKRMISDVPLGSFLSGGIDSSLVTAIMQKNAKNAVKTYSIGFEEQGYNEAETAKKIANHLGTDHTEFYVTSKEALDTIPDIPQIYDEPFADPSQIPTYLLCKLATKHVTVALAGDGGDELFCGYSRYARYKHASTFLTTPQKQILQAALKLAPLSGRHKKTALKLSNSLNAANDTELYDNLLSYWNDFKPAIMRDQVQHLSTPETTSLNKNKALSFAETMMAHDTLNYLPDDILVKVDRASMASSLEVRAPLLDYRLLELSWTLPMNLLNGDGQGKYILRRLLENYIPKPLFDRPKQGFGIPHGEWIKGPLQDWAHELLDEKRINQEGYFNSEAVNKSWDMHTSGKQDQSYNLWIILMFQSWLNEWG